MTDHPEDAVSGQTYAEIIRNMAFMENHHLNGRSAILFATVHERDAEIAARRAYGNISRPLSWAEAFVMQPVNRDGERCFKSDRFGYTILTEADRLIATPATDADHQEPCT